MAQRSMAPSNYGPVRNLDHLGRSTKRPSMREAIEARAKQAKAIVAARVACECKAREEAEEARRKLEWEREEEVRASRELRKFLRWLDREHREHARTEHARTEHAQAEREQPAPAKRHRRRGRRGGRSRRWQGQIKVKARPITLVRSSGPPPAWAGTPATQPTRLSREELADIRCRPSRTRSELSGPLTHDMAEKLAAALVALAMAPTPPEPERGLRFCPEDYTNPQRGPYSGSALEEHKMDRNDLELYDESQRAEIAWRQLGHNSVNRPTHAVLAARTGIHHEQSQVEWAKLTCKATVAVREGAAPGSLTPERARAMMRTGSAPVPRAKPERRF